VIPASPRPMPVVEDQRRFVLRETRPFLRDQSTIFDMRELPECTFLRITALNVHPACTTSASPFKQLPGGSSADLESPMSFTLRGLPSELAAGAARAARLWKTERAGIATPPGRAGPRTKTN
jgi:hypothetical protein